MITIQIDTVIQVQISKYDTIKHFTVTDTLAEIWPDKRACIFLTRALDESVPTSLRHNYHAVTLGAHQVLNVLQDLAHWM